MTTSLIESGILYKIKEEGTVTDKICHCIICVIEKM